MTSYLKPIALWVCAFLLSIPAQAQFGNVWVFGHHYGLDFNSGSPVFFDTTAIESLRGYSSVCDSSGQLLFYTDGGRVWNRQHRQMPHGDSLAWVRYMPTGTYPGITKDQYIGGCVQIIPIERSTRYYIFTTDNFDNPNHALQYHIVDMAADNGLGDVVVKNRLLQTGMMESLAAVRHCNGRDWWVVGRKGTSDEYLSFLVRPDTVINAPVISNIGAYHHGIVHDWVTVTKISPNGNWLATAYVIEGNIELARFNDATGETQVVLQDYDGGNHSLGCSFSSDSRYLYASTMQFDSVAVDTVTGNTLQDNFIARYYIGNPDSLAILQSKFHLIEHNLAPTMLWSHLQLAPDGHIYALRLVVDSTVIPQMGREELLVIRDGADTLSEPLFVLRPNGAINLFGLPTFPDAIFTNHHKASLRIPGCTAGVYDSIPFFDSLLTNTRDYLWDFGDPASGNNNTADVRHPIHAFSAPGIYTVTLSLPSECNPITVTRQVTVSPLVADTPVVSLNQTFLESTTAAHYQWFLNDTEIAGAISQQYVPSVNGTYTVLVTDSRGCTQTSAPFSVTTVGQHKIEPGNRFRLFPNPAKEILIIENNDIVDAISITDITGKEALHITNPGKTIAINTLAKGFYIVQVLSKSRLHIAKFVKE